jgi:hypothetical protein
MENKEEIMGYFYLSLQAQGFVVVSALHITVNHFDGILWFSRRFAGQGQFGGIM